RQLGDLVPQVGEGLRPGGLDVGLGPAAHLGQLLLEAGLLLALELVGGLAGLLDDAAGLGLGVVQLGPVLGQQLLGLGPLLLGRLEVVADPLGAGVHRLA